MKIDKKIIRGLKERDEKAYKDLFKLHSDSMRAIAYRYMKSWELADDIVQETFLVIYNKIDQYTGRGFFLGWVNRIVINLSIKYLKEKNKNFTEDITKLSIPEEKDIYDDEDLYSMMKEVEISKEEIMECIKELPEGSGVIFHMFLIDGMKHKEIAKILNITESTSRTQYFRAKKMMKIKLAEKIKIKYNKKINREYKDFFGNE